MAKKSSMKKSDILNGVEGMEVKPVVVSTEVTGENGETETVTTTIEAPIVEDATGTSTGRPKTTMVEVEPGVVVEISLGRPVNPNSERQKKLAAQQARAAANGGTAKLGRPAVPGSANQLKKAEMEAKKANPDYVAKRGRPVMEGSARQQSLAEKDNKLKARARQIAIEKGLIKADTPEVSDVPNTLVEE